MSTATEDYQSKTGNTGNTMRRRCTQRHDWGRNTGLRQTNKTQTRPKHEQDQILTKITKTRNIE